MSTDDVHGRQGDAEDLAVLRDVQALWEIADPMPPELTEVVEFALELAKADSEVLQAAVHQDLPAARGDERTRLVTFDGAGITVMVDIALSDDGTARVDGWLTPAAPHRVELRRRGGPLEVTADERGRFAFDRVPRGMVQLVVHADRTVTTPVIVV
ncbi:hypothetical protein AB0A74_01900 [Saccharothrix sp. NPDC042600]|uniref:hypothetical protein n=1 Tax=Saccharothrix TaxID=2071 RepID=UPI0033D990C1|nr:hypothetical protein GCM10017745_50980 [Saccharothrix mutabilis subsp. capreolus]